ncbi:MAG: phosphopantetheine-binding protein [Nitrospiraceae bacterium]
MPAVESRLRERYWRDRAAQPDRISAGRHLEQVLGVTQAASVKDNFDLGGYSLLALRMFSAIERTFGKRLLMAVLFQAPTIEQLATCWPTKAALCRADAHVAIRSGGNPGLLLEVPWRRGNVLVFACLAKLLGETVCSMGCKHGG